MQPQQQVYQPQQPQQTVYQPQQPQQVVYQQPTPQTQPQTVYVNQYGQPIAAPTQQGGQPQVVYVQSRPQQMQLQPIININTNQNTSQQVTQQQQVVVAQPIRQRPDDPTCLYVLACFGFLFWPIGAIGMCIYSCGSNLPPKQAQAFKILVGATVLGIILYIIYYVATSS
eukprot:UN06744